MMQKFYVALTKAGQAALRADSRTLHCRIVVCSRPQETGEIMAVIYPRHASLRFEIANIPGVTVLPGHHDPGPIGADAAALMTVVKALPTETMRTVATRLHSVYGPDFHPDT
jgi:hypothetical protein